MLRAVLSLVCGLLCFAGNPVPWAAVPQGPVPSNTARPGAAGNPGPSAEPVDINRASFFELKSLPGMGAVYAQRVIDGRPYQAKNQLVTRGVLPAAAYERIRERIIAHRAPRP